MKGNEFDTIEGMITYIGTKISGAKPMNRQEYNDFRGWILPADENGADAGYIVQYFDGYVSWSPAEQFEQAYRPTSGMSFGLAVEAARKGLKVARKATPDIILTLNEASYHTFTFGVGDISADDWQIIE